jgi:hypothetical protein
MGSTIERQFEAILNQGYARLKSIEHNPSTPGLTDVVSHDKSVVLGPPHGEIPLKQLLEAGAYKESRYNEGAGVLLGERVARHTRGHFPEWWRRFFTDAAQQDFETVGNIIGYMQSSLKDVCDPYELRALILNSTSTYGDLYEVTISAHALLGRFEGQGDLPEVEGWREQLLGVLERIHQGPHAPRVNRPLKFDNGDMLAVFTGVAHGALAYVGTKRHLTDCQRRDALDGIASIESVLNPLPLKQHSWLLVRAMQAFGATLGVEAELLTRNAQTSTRLMGTDVSLAFSRNAAVSNEALDDQTVGPRGAVNEGTRRFVVNVGRINVVGIDFTREGAGVMSFPRIEHYRHMRVMRGSAQVQINENNPFELGRGSSVIALPGSSVSISPGSTFPTTVAASTMSFRATVGR